MTAIGRTTSLTVGVVIVREPINHPWQEFRWRPAEILIGKSDLKTGDTISVSEAQTRFFGGNFKIELHRKETEGYVVNLENVPPSVYIVLQDNEDGAADMAVMVETITVSPFEAQDYLDSGEDIIEPIPMAAPLVAWLERFVAEHHQEETFIKRKRDKLDIHQEKFGQEPLERIRQRQQRRH